MKQVSIQIPFDDEKLEALKIFLSQKDQTAEAVIVELIDGLYRKTVPLWKILKLSLKLERVEAII